MKHDRWPLVCVLKQSSRFCGAKWQSQVLPGPRKLSTHRDSIGSDQSRSMSDVAKFTHYGLPAGLGVLDPDTPGTMCGLTQDSAATEWPCRPHTSHIRGTLRTLSWMPSMRRTCQECAQYVLERRRHRSDRPSAMQILPINAARPSGHSHDVGFKESDRPIARH